MTGKLVFSKKTWYSAILISALCSLVTAGAVLAGQSFDLLQKLQNISFALYGISLLFLAAEKDNTPAQRKMWFGCFLVLMAGYLFGGVLGLLAADAAWPVFIYCCKKEGRPELATPFALLAGAEAAHFAAWVLATYLWETLRYGVNLLWLMAVIAQAACAWLLVKRPEPEAQVQD